MTNQEPSSRRTLNLRDGSSAPVTETPGRRNLPRKRRRQAAALPTRIRRDVRLFAGIALAGVGVALAWTLWPNSAQATTSGYVSVRNLPAGLVLRSADVSKVDVQVPGSIASMIEPVAVGQRLTRPVIAGALLTSADVSVHANTSGRDSIRFASINVEPGHAPPHAQRGDVVEIWATADRVLGASPSTLVARVVIADVADADSSLGDRVFVVQMSQEQSPRIVAALRNHQIDLVEVAQ